MIATPFHPVSEIFPLMTGAAFEELVADIKANGLRESIWTHDGKIIDGRNRYLACEQAGVEPTFRAWDQQGDLVKFVVSLNLHRRHLSESQRAMIAAKLADRPTGRTKAADERETHDEGEREAGDRIRPPGLTTKEAAELLNVGKSTIVEAKRIRKEAAPDVVAAVESGEVSTHMATRVLELPKADQRAALNRELSLKGKRNRSDPKIIPLTKTVAGRKAPEAIRNAIGTFVGLASGLDSFKAKDAAPSPDEAAQWEKDLCFVISAINRFRRQLKEMSDVQAQ